MFWPPTIPRKFASLHKRIQETAKDLLLWNFILRSTLNTLWSVTVSDYFYWEILTVNVVFFCLVAGSSGDPNAPQLIIENRAVILDYAKDRNPLERNPNTISSVATKADWACSKCQCLNFARRNECFKCSTIKTEDCSILNNAHIYSSDHLNDLSKSVSIKTDWICNKCQCQNFAKRHECFKCFAPRNEDCIIVSANQNPDSDQITNAVSPSFMVFLNYSISRSHFPIA